MDYERKLWFMRTKMVYMMQYGFSENYFHLEMGYTIRTIYGLYEGGKLKINY